MRKKIKSEYTLSLFLWFSFSLARRSGNSRERRLRSRGAKTGIRIFKNSLGGMIARKSSAVNATAAGRHSDVLSSKISRNARLRPRDYQSASERNFSLFNAAASIPKKNHDGSRDRAILPSFRRVTEVSLISGIVMQPGFLLTSPSVPRAATLNTHLCRYPSVHAFVY